jgi:poly(3-hydroxybutyrate) depolymerase
MNRFHVRRFASQAVLMAAVLAVIPVRDVASQSRSTAEPLRRTITFGGAQREYFIHLPPSFDPRKTYWALVVVHGGGQRGLTPFPNARLARLVLESDLEAIVISPSFSNDDNNASRFPSLGEGEFLEAVLEDARKDHALRPKILLTGYSRGGQFASLCAGIERVAAVAPLRQEPGHRMAGSSSGTSARSCARDFSRTTNATRLPARLRDRLASGLPRLRKQRQPWARVTYRSW